MSDHQGCLVIAAVAAVFTALLLSAVFLQSGESAGPATAVAPKKRFEARSGTTREKARLLVSKREDKTMDKPIKTTSDGSGGASGGGDAGAEENEEEKQKEKTKKRAPIEVLSLIPPEEREQPKTSLVEETLNEADGENGKDREENLKDLLGEPLPKEEQAKANAALAQLYAEEDPPRDAEARDAWEKALSIAEDAETRRQIAVEYALYLLEEKDGAAAKTVAQKVLDESAALTESRLQLRLLQAKAYEILADPAAAEKAYRETILEASAPVDGQVSPEAQDAMRTASLRLVRLCRSQGNEEAARQLAADLKKQLESAPLAEPAKDNTPALEK